MKENQILPLSLPYSEAPPTNGTSTSGQAKRRLDESGLAATYRDQVLQLIKYAPDGMTYEEICFILGKRSHTVSARLRELLVASYIVPIGERLTTAQLPARVYYAFDGSRLHRVAYREWAAEDLEMMKQRQVTAEKVIVERASVLAQLDFELAESEGQAESERAVSTEAAISPVS